jgi:hypothetical protein
LDAYSYLYCCSFDCVMSILHPQCVYIHFLFLVDQFQRSSLGDLDSNYTVTKVSRRGQCVASVVWQFLKSFRLVSTNSDV